MYAMACKELKEQQSKIHEHESIDPDVWKQRNEHGMMNLHGSLPILDIAPQQRHRNDRVSDSMLQ